MMPCEINVCFELWHLFSSLIILLCLQKRTLEVLLISLENKQNREQVSYLHTTLCLRLGQIQFVSRGLPKDQPKLTLSVLHPKNDLKLRITINICPQNELWEEIWSN